MEAVAMCAGLAYIGYCIGQYGGKEAKNGERHDQTEQEQEPSAGVDDTTEEFTNGLGQTVIFTTKRDPRLYSTAPEQAQQFRDARFEQFTGEYAGNPSGSFILKPPKREVPTAPRTHEAVPVAQSGRYVANFKVPLPEIQSKKNYTDASMQAPPEPRVVGDPSKGRYQSYTAVPPLNTIRDDSKKLGSAIVGAGGGGGVFMHSGAGQYFGLQTAQDALSGQRPTGGGGMRKEITFDAASYPEQQRVRGVSDMNVAFPGSGAAAVAKPQQAPGQTQTTTRPELDWRSVLGPGRALHSDVPSAQRSPAAFEASSRVGPETAPGLPGAPHMLKSALPQPGGLDRAGRLPIAAPEPMRTPGGGWTAQTPSLSFDNINEERTVMGYATNAHAPHLAPIQPEDYRDGLRGEDRVLFVPARPPAPANLPEFRGGIGIIDQTNDDAQPGALTFGPNVVAPGAPLHAVEPERLRDDTPAPLAAIVAVRNGGALSQTGIDSSQKAEAPAMTWRQWASSMVQPSVPNGAILHVPQVQELGAQPIAGAAAGGTVAKRQATVGDGAEVSSRFPHPQATHAPAPDIHFGGTNSALLTLEKNPPARSAVPSYSENNAMPTSQNMTWRHDVRIPTRQVRRKFDVVCDEDEVGHTRHCVGIDVA